MTTSSTPIKPLEKLSEFVDEISSFSEKIRDIISVRKGTRPQLCYRGQGNEAWDSKPAIFREEYKNLAVHEKHAVRDLISVHPQEFSADLTMFDKLVRMQHFGLPTRLLDVSLNPLIALFFATDEPEFDGVVIGFKVPPERKKYFDSDSVSCIANLANMTEEEKNQINEMGKSSIKGNPIQGGIDALNGEDVVKRLHQFIRAEKPYFLPIINPVDLFKSYYVHPKMSNRRILAQAGAFIIYGLMPSEEASFDHAIEETKFIIPKEAKKKIRRELEGLGINQSTLFPEIDKAAELIKARYERAKYIR